MSMQLMHSVKTWPEYFQAVLEGRKTFEIRKNDRDYKVGDVLMLQEYCPTERKYSGRTFKVMVIYMTDYGQPTGQVVLGIKPLWVTYR